MQSTANHVLCATAVSPSFHLVSFVTKVKHSPLQLLKTFWSNPPKNYLQWDRFSNQEYKKENTVERGGGRQQEVGKRDS